MQKKQWYMETYDVWGNRVDGFEVNDTFREPIEHDFTDATKNDYAEYVRWVFNMEKNYPLNITECGSSIYVDDADGKPVCGFYTEEN